MVPASVFQFERTSRIDALDFENFNIRAISDPHQALANDATTFGKTQLPLHLRSLARCVVAGQAVVTPFRADALGQKLACFIQIFYCQADMIDAARQ
ncbi:hypothetical protein CG51_01580 [Haematobacter missouriensis]|nr:hypothetical protein CG51_01580 [Haematobacter missouriensis]